MECQNRCFWRVLSSWWLVLALLKSQNALKMGCFRTKKWAKNGSKMCFSKNDPRPFGVPKQVKGALLEPIASHFGHPKVTKCFENGLFWDQKSVKKMGQKCVFPKILLDFWGAQTSGMSPFGAHVEQFWPCQGRKGLENGPIWNHNGSKKGQNYGFPKMIRVQLWCPNR